MEVTLGKGVAREPSLPPDAFLLPQTVQCCPGTCVCSAEVPPWSCRDTEKLSLAQLWSVCGGQLENQHRNKPAASLPPLASQWGTGTEGDPAAALTSTLGQSWAFQDQNCLQTFYFPSAWCCHCWFLDYFSCNALITLKNQAQSSCFISDTVGEEVCCSLFPSPVSGLTFFSFLLELFRLLMTLGILFLN